MPSILITGATGFIGSHLMRSIIHTNNTIRVTIHQQSIQTDNLIECVRIAGIDESTDWSQALLGIDIVIHLAARAHVLKETSTDAKLEFKRVNTLGTINLASQAIKAGVKHFIFLSSIGAMATLSNDRLTEDYPCIPDTPYGQSKLEAEQGLIQVSHDSHMTWTILRPTLVYGPGNPGNMERLIKLIDRRFPLPLDMINNQRSFLYVGNLVDAIVRCTDHPGAKNQIFLVSDGNILSTTELVQQISIAMNQNSLLLWIPLPILRFFGRVVGQGQTIDRLTGSLSIDSNKIQSQLSWVPPYYTSQGLKETCNWYSTANIKGASTSL